MLRVTDGSGLRTRWQRARRAAIEAVVPGRESASADDATLLRQALASNAADAERRVFDNGLRLGDSYRKYHQVSLELAALPAIADELSQGAPCLHGSWRAEDDEAALVLERPGCPMGAGGPAVCDWWREAISGLVLGLTGGLRHTRHRSVGHGADQCVDIIYTDPTSTRRFGPIPAEMRAPLADVARSVAILDSSCRVEFLGLSDDVLYYQLPAASCGGGVRGQPLIERGIQRRFPRLALCEVTPRPVLSDP